MSFKIISKPIMIVATATLVASGLGLYVWKEQHRQPLLEIYVFALKSGRSMFVRTPDDQRILIDGGANSEIIRHLTDILPFYTRRIDTIIVTNVDDKNISGLIDVISRYPVDKIYFSKFTLENLGIASSTGVAHKTFLEIAKGKNIQIAELSTGEQVVLGQSITKKVTANILFPSDPLSFEYSKASAPELLFSISYDNTSLLFMGDASKKVQKHVASSSMPFVVDSDILIVSHSALPDNMAGELMKLVRPGSLIYETAVTKTQTKSSKPGNRKTATKKKPLADPLAAILNEDRFNLKEVGTIKITSDGREVVISGL